MSNNAGKFIFGGAAGGALTSLLVGNMGLAAMGGAVAITMAPVALLGGVIGLAAYGAKKALEEKKDEDPAP